MKRFLSYAVVLLVVLLCIIGEANANVFQKDLQYSGIGIDVYANDDINAVCVHEFNLTIDKAKGNQTLFLVLLNNEIVMTVFAENLSPFQMDRLRANINITTQNWQLRKTRPSTQKILKELIRDGPSKIIHV